MLAGEMRVLVVEKSESYVEGLGAEFVDRGFEFERELDTSDTGMIQSWCAEASPEDRRVILLPHRPADVVPPGRTRAGLLRVALMHCLDPYEWFAVIAAGFDGVVDWKARPTRICDVVLAAAGGDVLLPVDLCRRLATIAGQGRPGIPELSPSERAWMLQLAEGRSVAQVAREHHVSVRTLHRRLGSVYRRLGVENKEQAIRSLAARGFFGP